MTPLERRLEDAEVRLGDVWRSVDRMRDLLYEYQQSEATADETAAVFWDLMGRMLDTTGLARVAAWAFEDVAQRAEKEK